jgi:hypothetical protein
MTIEMMGWVIPDGPDTYLRLVKAVDRPAFAVHMDICNILSSPQRFYNNAGFIRECLRETRTVDPILPRQGSLLAARAQSSLY